jgi:hypothetical protein
MTAGGPPHSAISSRAAQKEKADALSNPTTVGPLGGGKIAPAGLYSFSAASLVSQGAALSAKSGSPFDRGCSIRKGFEPKLSRSPRRSTPRKGHPEKKAVATAPLLSPPSAKAAGPALFVESSQKEHRYSGSGPSPRSPTTKDFSALKRLKAELQEQLELDASRADLEAKIAEAETAEDFDLAEHLQNILFATPTSVREAAAQRRFQEAEVAAAAAEAEDELFRKELAEAAAAEHERLQAAAAEADLLRKEAAAAEREASKREAEAGLYHVDASEHLLVPRGKRVFCQGQWGVVEKARGGKTPWVEIRFDDNTKATNGGLGSALIRLDGRYSSPAVKIKQRQRRSSAEY